MFFVFLFAMTTLLRIQISRQLKELRCTVQQKNKMITKRREEKTSVEDQIGDAKDKRSDLQRQIREKKEYIKDNRVEIDVELRNDEYAKKLASQIPDDQLEVDELTNLVNGLMYERNWLGKELKDLKHDRDATPNRDDFLFVHLWQPPVNFSLGAHVWFRRFQADVNASAVTRYTYVYYIIRGEGLAERRIKDLEKAYTNKRYIVPESIERSRRELMVQVANVLEKESADEQPSAVR